jgi:ubiquinone/menaquinone biosynthesis C-methylase UbiE
MRTQIRRRVTMAVGLIAVAVGGLVAFPFGQDVLFHLSPVAWTNEPDRLAALLHLKPTIVVADIGAGDGAMALQMARVVGRTGHVYVTERGADQRTCLSERTSHLGNVDVIEALDDRPNLPDNCCDAVYLRMVWHHIAERRAYAPRLAKAVRPGGRLVIIDFPPSAFFHLEADHGVTAEAVIAALTPAGFTVEQRDDRWGRAFAISFVRSR